VLTPTEKGNIAEAEITAAAIRLGIVVLRPLAEGGRYDLVFDLGPRLLRVQCKWAARWSPQVVRVPLRTSRHTPNGYIRTTYSSDEIDGFAAYCPDPERCFYLPIAEFGGQSMVHLRLGPTGNNQAAGIKWAAEYEFGAIAQLGERLHGMQEVAGSSPASSIEEAARRAASSRSD
jgi:PD-(D/E)XK endonuclease